MVLTTHPDAMASTGGMHHGAAVTIQPAELRWAAAALGLGGVLFVSGVVLGLRAFGGEWDTSLGPTLPQTAELIRTKWPEFRIIWFGELLGALLLAMASLLLQRRPQERRRWLPAAVVWSAVGVGSLLVAVAYAITLGSYPHALAAFNEQPALFAALRGTTLAIHAVGSVMQLLGLIGAISIEFRWQGRSLPDRLVQAAAGVALLGSATALAGLIAGEYVAAAIFAATVLLGMAIWQRAGESAQRNWSMTAASGLVAAVTSLTAPGTGAHAQTAEPILDMHMHAMAAAAQGPPPRGMCAPFSRFPAFDPGSAQRAELMAALMQPSSSAMERFCDDVLWSPVTDAEVIQQTVAAMERRNMFGVLSGTPSRVAAWQAAAPGRFIPALQFDLARNADITPDSLRRLARAGAIALFGEVTNQYSGVAADDAGMMPYWAVAEELDLPVGIHIGAGPPGIGFSGGGYRARLSSALTLEEVVVRHPHLRVYIMHAGWPRLDDLLALLYVHPQVHVDVSWINYGLPRGEFHAYLRAIVEAGFGDRVMFGSDSMIWPDVIERAIAAIEEAPFLTAQQKRDILYNNAARFLRLSDDEIRRHHGSRLGPPTPTSARDVAANVLAITRANVVDVASGSILANRTILIRDGRIDDVGASDSVAVPVDAMRVDADGQYLMPGLWDAHVHSATSAEWHFPLFIAHGITSVRNMHTSVDTGLALTNALKRRIASGELAGPRFLANGGVVDGRAAIWPGSVTVENAEAARAAVDSLVDGGADFIKVYDRLSAPAFAGIMAAARTRGIAVDGHAPMAVDPVHAASAGMRTVEHGTGIVMGCSSRADSLRIAHEEHRRTAGADGGAAFFRLMQTARDTRDPAACERTVQAFVQHGVAVTPTLVDLIGARVLADTEDMRHMPAAVTARWTAMAQSGPDAFTEFLEAGRDMRIGNVRMMHEAGVTILAGTDVGNPFIVPGASLHRELEILVRDVGMSPLEALRSGTLNPARVFDLADSLGIVAPGMRADLVLLRANPLDDIRNTRMISGVVLRGRFLDRRDLDALLEAAAHNGR
jgi:uncharacterized protein